MKFKIVSTLVNIEQVQHILDFLNEMEENEWQVPFPYTDSWFWKRGKLILHALYVGDCIEITCVLNEG